MKLGVFGDLTLSRSQMGYQNKKHEPVIAEIALSASIFDHRERFNSQPTFLDQLSILFFNKTLARLSR
jgi:hypothetical protein